ncbi:MAG TPA: ATP-binding protein, partial [Lacunisphaera sp.]
VAGFNIADRVLRFDEAAGRFEPDPDFGKRLPAFTALTGRPGVDARGRLWMAADNKLRLYERTADGGWSELPEQMPPGLQPYYFTFEDGGVVWIHAQRRVTRYDPDLAAAKPAPLRALITHVSLPGTRREIFELQNGLPALEYTDNSIVAHFLAPGDPLNEPVAFDVMLEGSGGTWTAAGSSGSAVFNGLKEGSYVLHVRPRSETNTGDEATLGFSIRPPWYRSGGAYAGYVLAALGVIWLAAFLYRRENSRLEQLVALRTRELNDTNTRLANQVEEIRMLSQAIEQSPAAILITNPSGTIVFANPRIAALTGYAADELIGRDLSMLRPADFSPELSGKISKVLEAGQSWSGQLVGHNRNGGSVPVRVTITPLRSPSGKIRLRLYLAEDITEWVAEQERRRKLESQLVQSQKLESLGTMAGGIAHDFNNILTGMLGYTELARMSVPADSELQQQLAEVSKAGLRAKDLVAQILTFSRHSTTRLVPIDLAGPVEEAVRLLRASTPATIEIAVSLESGTVRADSTQIQQVVLNLGTNAVHAMNGRPGKITVALRRVSASPQLAAEVSRLPEGASMCLQVSDEGHGMDAATMERIFDPFFTTKGQGEGTGLGLSIVQGIVTSHHGAYRVQSTVGKGTVFELYFPLRWEQAVTPPPTGPAPKGARQEILVVDDEPMVADYITHRLKRLDYGVTTFTDPRKALAACQATPERFHAIVTDLTMPHLTGVELISQIRQLGRMIPSVIVTGYGKGATAHQLTRCQMLHKPFSGEDLARTLAHVLRL